MTLERFLHFKITFRGKCEILLVRLSAFWDSGISKFVITLEKNEFKIYLFFHLAS